MVTHEEKNAGNVLYKINRWYDDDKFYKQIEVDDEEKNIHEKYCEEVRKFSLDDFTEMFTHEGLTIENVFGNYSLEQYNLETSPRMIIVAKKNSLLI